MGEKINELIQRLIDEALKNSHTYNEAMCYLDKNMPLNSVATEIKKEAQKQITKLALSQKI